MLVDKAKDVYDIIGECDKDESERKRTKITKAYIFVIFYHCQCTQLTICSELYNWFTAK